MASQAPLREGPAPPNQIPPKSGGKQQKTTNLAKSSQNSDSKVRKEENRDFSTIPTQKRGCLQ
jgi:hypothetical protein